MHFLFPFEEVQRNSQIVLYGAGECGQQYYRQITISRYCNIALWCDKAAKTIAGYYHMPVSKPDMIEELNDFDHIVIAISDSHISSTVARYLSAEYRIPAEKIITKINDIRTVRFNNKWEQYALAGSDRCRNIEEHEPFNFITYRHLSVSVRYLVCRDFLNGVENKDHISLYSRMIFARIRNVREGIDSWSDYPVHGINNILEETKKLCFSLRDNGFDKEKAIPVNSQTGMIMDGGHRIAASLVLKQKVWVKYFANAVNGGDFGFDWFKDNGFSTSDLLLILRVFAELYTKCSIAVLFTPVIQHWDFIIKQFAKDFTIVGYVDLDFNNNICSYNRIIKQIYKTINGTQNKLKNAPFAIRVVLLSDEEYIGKDFYNDVRIFKNYLCQSLYPECAPPFAVLHTADDEYELQYLNRLLFYENIA